MDIRKLQRAIVDGLEDVKAQDIQVFNTEHLSPLFERVIVASGTSNRQTKSLAASVRDSVRTKGFPVMRTEGEENGEWIIVDCGAAVAHIMQPAIRQYYHLEELWGGKVVKMKFGDVKLGLVKATEPDKPKRAPAKVAAQQRTGSKPAGAGSASRSAGARKAPAKTAARKSAAPASARSAPKPGASARAASPSRAPTRKAAGAAASSPKRAAASSAARAPARTAAKPTMRTAGSGVVSRPTAKKSAPAKKTTRRS